MPLVWLSGPLFLDLPSFSAQSLINMAVDMAHHRRSTISSPQSTSPDDGIRKDGLDLLALRQQVSGTADLKCEAVSAVARPPSPPTDILEPPSEKPVVSPSPNEDPSQAVQPLYSTFSLWEKRLIVLGAALSAFFSPLTAQIYFPALNVLADDFRVSISKINLTVTTYMVFQGITPMFIGGLADTAGRRPAYVVCFVVYIAANIGVAVCQSFAELIVLRCLQSAGSASTVALCQAVVADIVTSAERGQYIGITSIPMFVFSRGPLDRCLDVGLSANTYRLSVYLRHH